MFSKTNENLRIALTTLQNSKMRSALTMIGITIGVMSVVLLLSLGQAFEAYVVGQFSSFGSNLVAVWGEVNTKIDIQGRPDEEDAEVMTTFFEPLSWDDYLAVSDPFRVPSARVVAPAANIAVEVRWGDTQAVIATAGVTETYADAVSLDVVAGQFVSAIDVEENARVVVFNLNAVEKIFGEDIGNPVGESVKLNGLSFEVIGVLDMGPDEQSASIIVPLSTLYQRLSSERLADGSLPIAVIMTQAHDAEAADKLVEEVRLALREEHELTDTQEDDFQIFAQNAFLESLSTITSLITAFLAVIAGISLIVGGIGIMNIMLVTVTERTREIGLRKAVGAQNSDILLQFITESIMLSAIGGLLGTLLAMGLSAMMSAGIPDLNIVIRPTSIALATTVSVMIGVFFGAFPANRAARMKPIDALRFE
jgi:putative ABC transport system permease protein